jgi:RHS repeat-associated protein
MQSSVSERLTGFEVSTGETLAIFELSRKELDEETRFYYYGARYLNPKTSMWISADPAMSDYIPSAPVDEEARKRNENLPGMGGVYNYVNFHVYHYAGNNPVKLVDPDGRKLKVIDESYGDGYRVNSVSDNRGIIVNNLSQMTGCERLVDSKGFISMGEIYKTGADWDAVRTRFPRLLDSDKVVGITTNTDSLTGWGFNVIRRSTIPAKATWAARNGITAYIQISGKVSQIVGYRHKNPNYKSWLDSFLGGGKGYLYGTSSLAGHTAHETLGHGTDCVTNGRYYDEYSALDGENLYHKAAGELSRDVY